MISKKTSDLINRDIDGRTTPEEHDRLKKVLATDPEMREFLDELRTLSGELARTRRLDAPATLKPSIMRSIAHPTSKHERKLSFFFLSESFLRKSSLRLGLAFSGGLALGILIFALVTGVSTSPSARDGDLSGTILFHNAIGTLTPGNTIEVNHGIVRGAIMTSQGQGLSLVRIRLSGAKDLSAEFSFDPSALRVEAFSPSRPGEIMFSAREGKITVTGGTIDDVGVLFASPGTISGNVHVRIISSHEVILDGPVSLVRK